MTNLNNEATELSVEELETVLAAVSGSASRRRQRRTFLIAFRKQSTLLRAR
jgi:hypothetical protein